LLYDAQLQPKTVKTVTVQAKCDLTFNHDEYYKNKFNKKVKTKFVNT